MFFGYSSVLTVRVVEVPEVEVALGWLVAAAVLVVIRRDG
jgi:hypothetical protein